MKTMLTFLLFGCWWISSGQSTTLSDEEILEFLKKKKRTWKDMNIPFKDGQVLYDLIIENEYKHIVEIGTSTGHSTIWLAWAASKTGGKVITIEIDERRHLEALRNLEQVGLSQFVDARLEDAHKLVPLLTTPIDFVFSDADKRWYTQYFKDIDPKLSIGGCFTAHNASTRMDGIKEFLEHVYRQENYETHIDRTSSSGILISFKKSERHAKN